MPPEQIPHQAPLPPQKPPFNFWETDPKRNCAPWFLTFCAALIIVGLGLTGYFKYKASENYWTGMAATTENYKTHSPWQMYRDREYAVEFKYPSDWAISGNPENSPQLKRNENGSGGLDVYKEFHKNRQENSEDMTGFCKISMGIFKESFADLTKELANNESGVTVISGPINVAGKEGVQGFANEIAYIPFVYIPYSYTETLSVALYAGGDVLKSCKQTFDQILSTFKFIDPKVVLNFESRTEESKVVEFKELLQKQSWVKSIDYLPAQEVLSQYKQKHTDDTISQALAELSSNPFGPTLTIYLNDQSQKEVATQFIKSQKIYSKIELQISTLSN